MWPLLYGCVYVGADSTLLSNDKLMNKHAVRIVYSQGKEYTACIYMWTVILSLIQPGRIIPHLHQQAAHLLLCLSPIIIV